MTAVLETNSCLNLFAVRLNEYPAGSLFLKGGGSVRVRSRSYVCVHLAESAKCPFLSVEGKKKKERRHRKQCVLFFFIEYCRE